MFRTKIPDAGFGFDRGRQQKFLVRLLRRMEIKKLVFV